MKHIILIIASAAILFTGCRQQAGQLSDEEIAQLHQSLYTIDTHTDTPYLLLREGTDLSIRNEAREGVGKIDIPRMTEGGLDGVFFAVYTRQGECSEEGYREIREQAQKIFDSIHSFIDRVPEVELALNSEDLKRISDQDRHAIYIGMENGYPVGRDLTLVEKYYNLGARYITLCHSSNNDICDSSTDEDGPRHGGLSEFGREVVREMNRLGMMIDISHMSDESFFELIECSTQPVFASHSCARAVCDHPRNLSDSLLVALADQGGVIQVCLVNSYVKQQDPARAAARQAVFDKHGDYYSLDEAGRQAFMLDYHAVDSLYPAIIGTVSDLVDHIDHIVGLIGIDYVGIGTDFDGGAQLEDCYDVTELGNITAELVSRGYSKADIQKIWSGNFLRVMKEVEKGREN